MEADYGRFFLSNCHRHLPRSLAAEETRGALEADIVQFRMQAELVATDGTSWQTVDVITCLAAEAEECEADAVCHGALVLADMEAFLARTQEEQGVEPWQPWALQPEVIEDQSKNDGALCNTGLVQVEEIISDRSLASPVLEFHDNEHDLEEQRSSEEESSTTSTSFCADVLGDSTGQPQERCCIACGGLGRSLCKDGSAIVGGNVDEAEEAVTTVEQSGTLHADGTSDSDSEVASNISQCKSAARSSAELTPAWAELSKLGSVIERLRTANALEVLQARTEVEKLQASGKSSAKQLEICGLTQWAWQLHIGVSQPSTLNMKLIDELRSHVSELRRAADLQEQIRAVRLQNFCEKVKHQHKLRLHERGTGWVKSWRCVGCDARWKEHSTVRRCSRGCNFHLCEVCFKKRLISDSAMTQERLIELTAASLSKWIYSSGLEAFEQEIHAPPTLQLPELPGVWIQPHCIIDDVSVGSAKVAVVTAHLPSGCKVLFMVFKGTSSLADLCNWNPEHDLEPMRDKVSFMHKNAASMIRNLFFVKGSDVMTVLDKGYRTGVRNLVLTGHSFGGLYASAFLYWAFRTRPGGDIAMDPRPGISELLVHGIRCVTFAAPMCFGTYSGSTPSREFDDFKAFALLRAVNFMNLRDPCPRAWSAVDLRKLVEAAAGFARKRNLMAKLFDTASGGMLMDKLTSGLTHGLQGRISESARYFQHLAVINLVIEGDERQELHWESDFSLHVDGFAEHPIEKYLERLFEAYDHQEPFCHVCKNLPHIICGEIAGIA